MHHILRHKYYWKNHWTLIQKLLICRLELTPDMANLHSLTLIADDGYFTIPVFLPDILSCLSNKSKIKQQHLGHTCWWPISQIFHTDSSRIKTYYFIDKMSVNYAPKTPCKFLLWAWAKCPFFKSLFTLHWENMNHKLLRFRTPRCYNIVSNVLS